MSPLLWLLACAADKSAPARDEEPAPTEQQMKSLGYDGAGPGAAGGTVAASPMAPPPATDAVDRRRGFFGGEGAKGREDADAKAPEKPAGPAMRSWFPESFLWAPSVRTDGEGTARVDVTVPDTLTSWRVLALGWSRAGAQGGAEASFQSTLAAYVELDTPSFLVAGDRVELPMQVTNQQDTALSAALDVTVRGGSGGGGGAVAVAPHSTGVRTLGLVAGAPGDLWVSARLGDLDAVQRTLPVRPAGFARDTVRGGTLAATRSVALGAEAGAHDGSLLLTAWPGAAGYVSGLVALRGGRSPFTLADAACDMLLAARARALAGDELDKDVLRALDLRAWQRVVRDTRAPDAWTAALARKGLGSPEDGTSAASLAERLTDTVARSQAPDGTWTMGAGTSIDRVLAMSTFTAWTVPDASPGLKLRLGGALGRNEARLKDPVLAAWALVSGAPDELLRPKLVETVKAALQTDESGAVHLPGTSVRADGQPTTELDATAVAALALADDPETASELVSWLLGQPAPEDGLSRLLVLEAVTKVLGGEVPASATLIVEVDGAEVARGTLDAKAPKAPVHLHAPIDAAAHTVTLRSEPPLPALAWQLDRRVWVDAGPAAPGGVDLAVTPPALHRDTPSPLTLALSAPSGSVADVVIGLPAGVRVDAPSLDALVTAGTVARAWQQDGELRLEGVRLDTGAYTASVPVIASVRGTLHAAPHRVTIRSNPDEPLVVPAGVWSVD